ncbi:hypothetical protein L195_g013138 [Trifolium pratense]|uniref:Uncharacterized protein n=1 Tax=Trifolium pratense TaxID=57577 RepID=A0A2K3PMA2_TRIPR|nr:hypothetical protein L195_g013138 [Trifolium pratense]
MGVQFRTGRIQEKCDTNPKIPTACLYGEDVSFRQEIVQEQASTFRGFTRKCTDMATILRGLPYQSQARDCPRTG